MRRVPIPVQLKVRIDGPEQATLVIGEESIVLTLVPSLKARRVRATLDGTRLAVRYPARISKKRLADSIYALSGWIMSAQAEMVKRAARPKDGIFLDGTWRNLAIEVGRPQVIEHADKLTVYAPKGQESHVLHRWLRRRATGAFPPLVAAQAALMNLSVAKIRIAAQTRRWGSCSTQGTISLNYRLTMAPLAVQRYLVIHELAHLQQMNHSPAYWAVVASYCPDYRTHEAWLKQHGWLLMES